MDKVPLLTSVILCSLFWISWPLKLGLIGCLKMLVWNYHSMLCNISGEHRSHMIGNAGLGLVSYGPVLSDLVWHSLVQPFISEL